MKRQSTQGPSRYGYNGHQLEVRKQVRLLVSFQRCSLCANTYVQILHLLVVRYLTSIAAQAAHLRPFVPRSPPQRRPWAPVGIRAPLLGATRGGFGGVRGPNSSQHGSHGALLFMVTYKWHAAIRAPADLRLVHVDEDPGVAEWTATSIAGYDALVCPANWLLVDEFDGSVWAGLSTSRQSQPFKYSFPNAASHHKKRNHPH